MSDKKENKNKKINKMTVSELDAALKKARDNNNNDTSKYVQHLTQRKEEVLGKQNN